MALTAEESELLAQLTAKAAAAEDTHKSKFSTLYDVVKYLVEVSDKFTANPEDRDDALALIDSLAGSSDAETH